MSSPAFTGDIPDDLPNDERALKNKLRRMQRKVKQLDKVRKDKEEETARGILLHHPYATTVGDSTTPALTGPPTPKASGSPGLHHIEYPLEQRRAWLSSLLAHASSFAFFLSPTAFLTSALPPPPGISPLSPFLLSSAYLCGALLSGSEAQIISDLLTKALKLTHGTENQRMGESGGNKDVLLENLQACLLLSRYYFYVNRLVEANYHSITAGALASPLALGVLGSKIRPRPIERVLSLRDGELIHALWKLIEHEAVLAIARGGILNVSEDGGKRGMKADTPWPRPLHEYDSERTHRIEAVYTIQELNDGEAHVQSSDCEESLVAKVTMLWYWCHVRDTSERFIPNQGKFDQLSMQINNFISTLPPVQGHTSTPPSSSSLQIHTMAHAASMTLHRKYMSYYPDSLNRVITSTREVFRLAGLLSHPPPPTDSEPSTWLDASFSVAWETACNALVLLAGSGLRQGCMWSLGDKLILGQGMRRMRELSGYCFRFQAVQEMMTKAMLAMGLSTEEMGSARRFRRKLVGAEEAILHV